MARFVITPSAAATPALQVVEEIDFTADVTTLDMSAGAGTYTLLKGDGATTKATITVGTDVSGGAVTYTTLQVSAGSGLQVNVSASASNKNFFFAVALPTTGIDIDKDCVMLEWLIDSLAFGGTPGSCIVQYFLSNAASNRGTPSYGLQIARNSSDTQAEYKTQRNYNSSITRSGAQIVAGTTDTAQHVQIITRNKGAMICRDTGTSMADPYTVSTFVGDTGTRTWSAAQPVNNDWGTPYASHLTYLAGSGDSVSFNVSKIRICKFSPYSS